MEGGGRREDAHGAPNLAHETPHFQPKGSTTRQTAVHALCAPAARHALMQLALLVWLPSYANREGLRCRPEGWHGRVLSIRWVC